LVKEGEIHIDHVIARTVKRSYSGLLCSAGRANRTGEHDKFGFAILASKTLEYCVPGVFSVSQDDPDKIAGLSLGFCEFTWLALALGLLGGRGACAFKKGHGVNTKRKGYPDDDQHTNETDTAAFAAHATKRHPSATLTATVFNI
jgi:hypothetical protein